MSQITDNFNTNININKSAIFHFLDGYLDPEIGNTKINVISYLKKILKDYELEIKILDYSIINYMTMECKLKFYNTKKNNNNKSTYNEYYEITLNKIDESLHNNDDNTDILNDFKYCIVPVVHNEHATSILFFQHNNNQYMMTINSGLGINIHNDIKMESDTYYEPFIGYLIQENISDNIDLCLKNILRIISIGEFYEILKLNNKLIYEMKEDSDKKHNVILIEPLISLFNNIIALCSDKLDKMVFEIDINIIKDTSTGETIHINDINDITHIQSQLEKYSITEKYFVKSDKSDKSLLTFSIIKGEKIDIKFSGLYYDFFHNIIKSSKFKLFDYSQVGLIDLSIFKTRDLSPFNINNNINENLIKKVILHYDEQSNKLYILSQESGSCTWFSKYWSVILYNVLITKDSQKYIDIVNHINRKSYEIIQSMFSAETFNNEYNQEKSQFTSMKNICKKLVDIGILNSQILEKQIDFIYDIEIDVKYKKNNLESISDNDSLININDLNDIDILDTQQIVKYIINKFIKNDIIHENTFIMFVYILFSKEKLLFSKEELLFTSSNIIDFIDKIKFAKKASSNHGKEEVLKYAREDNELKILDNYIEQWNNVNAFSLTDNHIKPSYYLDYIDQINYFCNFVRDININSYDFVNKKINLITNFTDNDIDLFITYLHKFKLLSCILTQIYKTLNNDYYKDDLIELTKNIGTFIFDNLISNMFTEKVRYIKSTNENFTIINFCEYTKFIIPCINLKSVDTFNHKSFLEIYPIDINNYLNIKKFIIKNPIYLSKLFPDIDSVMFIKFNIYEIFADDNIRNELLKTYGKIFWDKIKENPNINYFDIAYIIEILQLLFNKKIYIDDDFVTSKSLLSYQTNIYTLNDTLNILAHIAQTQDINSFITHIIENKNVILDPILKIKSILQDKIKDIIFTGKKIFIEGGEYNLVKLQNRKKCLLSKLFVYNEYTYFLLEKKKEILYIINNTEHIKFIIKLISNEDKTLKIKIKNIVYNNYPVLKFNDINLPFKNIIPYNCPHFIYNNGSNYFITFFINNNFNERNINNKEEDANMLGFISQMPHYCTFEIDVKNNLLSDKCDLDNFEEILLNYGSNNWNQIYLSKNNISVDNGFYFNDKTYRLYIDKEKLFRTSIRDTDVGNYDTIKLFNKTDESNNIIQIKYINLDIKTNNIEKIGNSIDKLLEKISKCSINKSNINYFKDKINKLLLIINDKLKKYNNELVQNNNLLSILNKNYYLYLNFINCYKYKNICLKLLEQIDNEDALLCSQSKIYYEILNSREHEFKYLFEIVFEMVSGITITNEQFIRYTEIINDFIKWQNAIFQKRTQEYNHIIKKSVQFGEILDVKYINQKGGACREQGLINKFTSVTPTMSYPLHHFMMGKGKSAVITPLVSIHLSLIYNKIIYIIVPTHLLKQTKETMNKYIKIFSIEENINIVSDIEIKKLFLLGTFANSESNNNIVFLIDEFDSIIDPLKSNYNEIIDKKISVTNLYKLLKNIVEKIKNDKNESLKIEDIDASVYTALGFNRSTMGNIIADINNILKQIKTNVLKENINWGIHPEKCYAIPYLNKDKPLIQSNFSSSVLTIFLTLYYFIILKNYKANKFIINFLINQDLVNKIFNVDVLPFNINEEFINVLLLNSKNKFDEIFDNIFNTILLPEHQYNCSFIDLINIDNIYKIGYSGTMNVNLPKLNSLTVFNKIFVDYDEKVNINYAIKNALVITKDELNRLDDDIKLIDNFFSISNIKDYNAIIDVVGLFKNIPNVNFARKISELIHPTTIIFLDETDNKFTIINDKIEPYNSNINYINPFFYYSQSHIVGIDIKQDNYPVLKGLCIIDKLTCYSDIAQSMFRLRKLNMGHTIDFLLIEHEAISADELLCIFNKNEELNFKQKEDYLIYQTIKSEIRKYRIAGECFIDMYKEKVKHYHLMDISDVTINSDLLDGIISYDEIKMVQLEEIYSKISSIDNLLKLVCNINSYSLEQQFQQEEEKIKKTIIETQNQKQEIINFKLLNFGFKNIDYTFENLLNLSIEIDGNFRFLPNLFSHPNANNFYKNNSGLFFVWLNENKTILIVPGFMIGYFINDRPVLDQYLTIINHKIISSIEFLDELKLLPFFTIFDRNTKIEINYETIHPVLLLIATIIINNTEIKNEKIQAVFNHFKGKYCLIKNAMLSTNAVFDEMINTYVRRINKHMYDLRINRLSRNYIYKSNDLDNINLLNKDYYKNKYLKYKNKYIQLKMNGIS